MKLVRKFSWYDFGGEADLSEQLIGSVEVADGQFGLVRAVDAVMSDFLDRQRDF